MQQLLLLLLLYTVVRDHKKYNILAGIRKGGEEEFLPYKDIPFGNEVNFKYL